MTLISKMIIFKLKYKNFGFRASPSPNGVRPKIPKAQMGFARKTHIFMDL